MTDLTTFSSKNCVLLINGSPATSASSFSQGDSLEVQADSGYKFTTLEFGYYDYSAGGVYNTDQLTLNSDSTVGTITAPAAERSLNWTIETESSGPAAFTLELTQEMLDVFTNNSATLQINGTTAAAGDIMTAGDTLKGVADEGYIFSETIEFTFYSNATGGTYTTYDFTMSDDGKSGELEFAPSGENWEGFTYRFILTTEQEAVNITADNRVYVVTSEDLKQLSVERFQRRSTSADSVVVDYGDYILGLIDLPFSLPSEYLGGNERIELGPVQTSVAGTGVSTDNLSYDLGSITVELEENNALDFDGVVCMLHIPNAGAINIDPYYVIGQTISIEYIFNLYDGTATINISSSFVNDEVFLTKNTTLGVNVPFSTVTDVAQVSNTNVDVGGFNHITTPFLEVVKYEALLKDGKYTIPIIDEDTLGQHTGYVEVENVDLSFGVNKDEKDEIANLLASGVTIND